MKFETIKNNKKLLLVIVVIFLVGLSIIISTSKAKYRTTESIKIVTGNISYSFADFNLIAMYQENANGTYNEITRMPEEGYAINEELSYCNVNGVKDTSAILKTIDGNHTFSNLQKGSKCYLYFDKLILATDQILANKTINARTDFSAALPTDTTGIMYEAEDDDGTTYYFAGNPTDNWVKFAGLYWRIIRINGDGTIRMIYQGTAANTTGTGTQLLSTSAFNSYISPNNMYVGYMYTSNQVHGLGTSSKIKGVLDNWYTSNLMSYASYIDTNAGFCGDRQPSRYSNTMSEGGGTGTTTTYYAASIRLGYATINPTFKCTYEEDLYTTLTSTKGNNALSVPIGLISADEVGYARNQTGYQQFEHYLITGQDYWTMTPTRYSSNEAIVFGVSTTGTFGGGATTNSLGVRPVINLRENTVFSPDTTGTSSNPYEVI